jgi:hypothetical protein
MTHQDTPGPEGRGPTTAQLRDDIQSGRTGDKVPGFDPAAAPLGADDEAGGTPPLPREIAQARAQETAGPSTGAHPNGATPEMQPNARLGGSRGMVVGAAVGIGAAALLAALLVAAL